MLGISFLTCLVDLLCREWPFFPVSSIPVHAPIVVVVSEEVGYICDLCLEEWQLRLVVAPRAIHVLNRGLTLQWEQIAEQSPVALVDFLLICHLEAECFTVVVHTVAPT